MKQNEIFEQAHHQFIEITGTGVNILAGGLATQNKNGVDRLMEMRVVNQNARF